MNDALSDFIEMTAGRFAKDRGFRLRLLSEADETAREAARRVHREMAAPWGPA